MADAVAGGYELNLPLRIVRGTGEPPAPLVRVDGDAAVTVESVKPADDRSGDVAVRLYEAHGGRGAATVRASFPVASAQVTDLLERPTGPTGLAGAVGPTGPVALDGDGRVPVRPRPFQMPTLRITPCA